MSKLTIHEKILKYLNEPCPDEDKHTPHPVGFVEWNLWAEEMGKTHKQVRCKTCARFVIWVRTQI